LIHGDCRDVLPLLEPVDLVLTDPPYLVGKAEWDGEVSLSDHVEWIGEWFGLCRKIAKTLIVIPGQKYAARYAMVEPWKWMLMWHKPAAMARSPVGFCNCAPVLMWGRHDTKTLQTDVITAPIVVTAKLHPTMKPTRLMKGILRRFGESQSTLDPFAGSGTTLRAAKDLGRKCIGIEIEEKYCKIAAERLRQEVLF
jgi:DNA modification methylase